MFRFVLLCVVFFARALAFVYLLLQTKINLINYNRRARARTKTAISDHKSLRLNAAFSLGLFFSASQNDYEFFFDVCVTVLLGCLRSLLSVVNAREP